MAHERAEPDQQVGERRRYLRYAEAHRVLVLELGGAEAAYAGRLRDLSAGGVCLVTSREFSVGTRLCLGIFFPHVTKRPLVVLAHVRRCSPEAEGFALGLEFVRASRAQQRSLRWIQKYLVEQYGQQAT